MNKAAKNRLFKNKFVCMKCKATVKGRESDFREGKLKCRKCGCTDLRKISSDRDGRD